MFPPVAVSTTGPLEQATSLLRDHEVPNAGKMRDLTLLEFSVTLGIVYISTSQTLHYPHVRNALDNKRNLLLEIPLS